MIQINRSDIESIADLHYTEYFINGEFSRKLHEYKNEKTDHLQSSFFSFLYDRIEDVIKGTPEMLEQIINEANHEHPLIMRRITKYQALKKRHKKAEKKYKSLHEIIKKKTLQINAQLIQQRDKAHLVFQALDKSFKKVNLLLDRIESVFNYNDFCSQYGKDPVTNAERWGAYQLVKKLQINVCPYCNRHYISTSEPVKGEKGRTRPQLDHFYSQSKFPFLAISIYNLIPSCYVCNSNLKRDNEFTRESHMHPYEQGFGDTIQFTVQFHLGKGKLDYLKAWYGDPDLFRIGFKINPFHKAMTRKDDLKKLLRRVNNHKRVFKLRSLYNSHRDVVGEIIIKSIIYNDEKIEQFQKDFPLLFPTKDDVTRLLYTNYVDVDKQDRRVLAKLTRDITREFGIHHT